MKLVTNWWFEFDHIGFLMETFHTESEGLGAGYGYDVADPKPSFDFDEMLQHRLTGQASRADTCNCAICHFRSL
jgi:hypothetical protein